MATAIGQQSVMMKPVCRTFPKEPVRRADNPVNIPKRLSLFGGRPQVRTSRSVGDT